MGGILQHQKLALLLYCYYVGLAPAVEWILTLALRLFQT